VLKGDPLAAGARMSSGSGNTQDQLEAFAKSELLTLSIAETTPAQRSAAHSWIETHPDAAVRAWVHVSKTVGGERVLHISRDRAEVPGGVEVADKASSSAERTPTQCENVLDQLAAFADSDATELTLTGTSSADRSAAHRWVETHEDAAVRGWRHVSDTMGGVRVLCISKADGAATTAGTQRSKRSMSDLAPAKWGSGEGGGSGKPKRKRKRGTRPDSELTPEELDRRNHQRRKQQEALARQAKGLPSQPSSKRRRANHTMRRGHNHGAPQDPPRPPPLPPPPLRYRLRLPGTHGPPLAHTGDSKADGDRKRYKEAEAAEKEAMMGGGGFMQAGAWHGRS
jgi:hypothetical protein